MKKMVVLFIGIVLVTAANIYAGDISDMLMTLKQVKNGVDSTLSEIDTDLKAAAEKLSGMDFKSDDARKVLKDLCKFRPYVVDCSIIDADGLKVAVEPDEYRKYEDADRSSLPSVIKLLKAEKPVLSDVYASAEGVNAVSAGYPIFSNEGELRGAVRMLIMHEQFLKPIAEGKPYAIWMMQPNGLIIYDEDPEEVGKNIFTDPMYESFGDLVSLSKTVALNNNGAGSYDFYAKGTEDRTIVKKIAAWDTAKLYDTEWRVIAIEIEEPVKKPVSKEKEDKEQ